VTVYFIKKNLYKIIWLKLILIKKFDGA
jgi:hypothetical protein